MDERRTLHVGICGAGVASLCLAFKLSQLPHFKVDIYEARAESGEDGAAFGLGINAQKAMFLIAPEIREALDKAGGTIMEPAARFIMGIGPEAGAHIADVSDAFAPQILVQRSKLIRELRALLVPNIVHTGKKLAKVDESPTGIKLTFEDKSDAVVDCLIGCDGINSVVRSYVLGSDHPNLHAAFTGGHGGRAIISLSDAIDTFGDDYCRDKTQKVFVGHNAALLTDFNDDGKSMQVIAGFSSSAHSRPLATTAFGPFPKDEFQEICSAFGSIGDAIASVFLRQPVLYLAASRYHSAAPTYANGLVCIAGDAAYAFPPGRGAGAGQAIEDALILGVALEQVQSSDGVRQAMAAYDEIRRPQRNMVAESSGQAVRLITGNEPGVGLDIEKLRKHVLEWNTEIFGYDLDAACQRTVQLMKQ